MIFRQFYDDTSAQLLPHLLNLVSALPIYKAGTITPSITGGGLGFVLGPSCCYTLLSWELTYTSPVGTFEDDFSFGIF